MNSVTHTPRAPGKLVRDKIPDIIRASGRQPSVRDLDDLEYKAALDAKLLEEATELRDSTAPDDMVQELADVLEVLRGIADLNNLPWATVEQAATIKRTQRGGFTARHFLES